MHDYLERWRPYALLGDILLALVIFALSVAAIHSEAPDCDCQVNVWAYVSAAGYSLPLVARRTAPFAVNLVIAPSQIIAALAAWPALPAPLGSMIALHAAAAYARRWQAYLLLATALVAAPAALLAREAPTSVVEIVHTWLVVGVAWLLGDASRYRRAALDEARRRERVQQRLRAAEAASAVAEERARIAREMHDLLTHSVSVMVVLAEGGAASADTGRSDPARVFEAIATRGRRTMDELRGTLGTLRERDRNAAEGEAALEPLPGIADLPTLVTAMQEAGVAVSLDGTVTRPVNPMLGLTVYRIVQESLTNAVKHAPGQSAEVRIVDDERGLRVRITNQLPATSTTGPATQGHGLPGMRERAAAVGGRLHIDRGDGRWTVEFVHPAERG